MIQVLANSHPDYFYPAIFHAKDSVPFHIKIVFIYIFTLVLFAKNIICGWLMKQLPFFLSHCAIKINKNKRPQILVKYSFKIKKNHIFYKNKKRFEKKLSRPMQQQCKRSGIDPGWVLEGNWRCSSTTVFFAIHLPMNYKRTAKYSPLIYTGFFTVTLSLSLSLWLLPACGWNKLCKCKA